MYYYHLQIFINNNWFILLINVYNVLLPERYVLQTVKPATDKACRL